MKLITAVYHHPKRTNKPHALMAANLVQSAKNLGYDLQVYPLYEDPADSFTNDHYRVHCRFKPTVIKNALLEHKQTVVWLDTDCLLQRPIDNILGPCNAAFTLRPVEDRFKTNNPEYDGYINAGVMAFNYSDESIDLIDEWIKELPKGRADQDALARVLLRNDKLELGSPGIIFVGKAKVMLRTNEYNFFNFEDSYGLSNARVIHLKGIPNKDVYNRRVKNLLGSRALLIQEDIACH